MPRQFALRYSARPTVSIVMPFHNVSPFIAAAIESVLEQTYRSWELLAVDDGSTDGSTQVVREYSKRYPGKIRYFEHEGHVNRGASASRNVGGHHTRGEYIAYLDADDVWLPYKLERQVALLTGLPRAEMVMGATKYWYSWSGGSKRDKVISVGAPPDRLYAPGELLKLLYPLARGAAPSMNTVMIRAGLLSRIGGWEEDFKIAYTDQAFLVKLYLGAHVFVASEVWDLYRQHPNSSVRIALSGDRYHKIRFQFLSWFQKYLRSRGLVGSVVWNMTQEAIRVLRERHASS
jgi:glycosyltransferase involved in cell wall biosynthesis